MARLGIGTVFACIGFCFLDADPLLTLGHVADAVLVGGILLPHGDFALDPTFFAEGTPQRASAEEVALGSREAGRWLVELHREQLERQPPGGRYLSSKGKNNKQPLVVLLTTPHGIKLDYDYGVYASSRGRGSATIGRDCLSYHPYPDSDSTNNTCLHKPYNVTLDNVSLAPQVMAEDLVDTLRRSEKRHPVSAIYGFDEGSPLPLGWGEIVPLSLLPGEVLDSAPLLPLVWTFPHRRYDQSTEMVPELLDVGADLAEWAAGRPEPIAVVVSGDLSHTHLAEGPYGYSAASEEYDTAIGMWAGESSGSTISSNINSGKGPPLRSDPCDPGHAAALLGRAKEMQPMAKSCGFTGYVLWHGMMCRPARDAASASSNGAGAGGGGKNLRDNGIEAARTFRSGVLANRNATYYGMIAAVFQPDHSWDSKRTFG